MLRGETELLDSDWDDTPPSWLPQQCFCSGGLDDLVRNDKYAGDPDHIGPMISDNPAWKEFQRQEKELLHKRWQQTWDQKRQQEQPPPVPEPASPVYVSLYPERKRPERPIPNPPPDRPIDKSRPYEIHTICGFVTIYPPGWMP